MELQFHHREFEYEVRSQLNIFDRAVTDADAKTITYLDLSNFTLPEEDQPVLSCFSNLENLYVSVGTTSPEFWFSFPKMKDLIVECLGYKFDFESFRNMAELEALTVSGGQISDIPYVNTDVLLGLKNLSTLELHEFGSVDILPISQMNQLRYFALRYADDVTNIDAIGSMDYLDTLILDGLYVDNLDFLDSLPDSISIEMCGIQVYEGVDVEKWKRFKKKNISEISIGKNVFNYIDLSELKDDSVSS